MMSSLLEIIKAEEIELSEAVDSLIGRGDKGTAGLYRAFIDVLQRIEKAALSQQESGEQTVCCGRKECGGECGNEWQGMENRTAPPSTAQEDKEQPAGFDKCPITGAPFWGNIEHPTLGVLATYGGPFDTYTVPYLKDSNDGSLVQERFDHDEGGWVDSELAGFYSKDQPAEFDPQPTAQGVEEWIQENQFTAWCTDQEYAVVDAGDLQNFLSSPPLEDGMVRVPSIPEFDSLVKKAAESADLYLEVDEIAIIEFGRMLHGLLKAASKGE